MRIFRMMERAGLAEAKDGVGRGGRRGATTDDYDAAMELAAEALGKIVASG